LRLPICDLRFAFHTSQALATATDRQIDGWMAEGET
jgi:hypothetical protein